MGYGYAAVQLIEAWQRRLVPVWGYENEAPIIFNMGQPHWYHDYIEGAWNIGYTSWESTDVPPAWPMYMNLMDEIWTPCEANAQWFRDGGVTVPIRVLPHGLNRIHYPLQKRYKKPDEPFKFLHIGGDSRRKGADIAYKVFRELFGDWDGVELTLKGRRFEFDPKGANVNVLTDVISQDEMRELYLDHHGMIYPTRGEGFGFIPFNAAATGMPTAVTNWSGPVDYMKHCYPIGVEMLVEPDYEPHVGLWAEPDEHSIAMWMESFVKSPDYFFQSAYRKASSMDSVWSWDSVADKALKWMTESLVSLPS